MKRTLMTIIMVFALVPVFACLILFITDGRNILVANHEDWYGRDAEISFVPAEGKSYGMLYFDFASEKTAQGGMNTEGLFFDGTRTPYAPYSANNSKPECHCYIWKKILAECSTVDQALAFIRKYKVPEIEDIHILLADKSGNSIVVGIYNDSLQVHRRSKNYQLLTNFNLNNPSYGDEPPCERFARADSMLALDAAATVSNLEKILSKTHQGALTVYSNICNLTTGETYIYQKANFKKKVKINLADELKKGKHTVRISALFR
ncbi:MAG: linear amide C-N hydrolase [Chitinophagales bacterium]